MNLQHFVFGGPHPKKAGERAFKVPGAALALLTICCLTPALGLAQEAGVTDKTIRIGATMPLEGDHKTFGIPQKQGIEAALAGQLVQKRTIEWIAMNDFYDPAQTVQAAKTLINQGIFAMVMSHGTPTMNAVLPLLAENKVPAFGFFTGAGFTGPGDVLNVRASYVKEMEALVDVVLEAGVKPTEVCAYVQNDGYGMGGLKGIKAALAKKPGNEALIAKYDQIIGMTGDEPQRNNIGPVGVYGRDTTNARNGYESLKKWEASAGNRCRLVVTMAVFAPAAEFMAYSRYKNESWIISSPSPTTGQQLATLLKEKGVTDKVIASQVVPPLDSTLPLVVDARKALGVNLNLISLESYMVGRLFVTILQAIDGPLTRENFLKAARRQVYDIGGIKMDFTTDNQGSDFVALTVLRDGHFVGASSQDFAALFK